MSEEIQPEQPNETIKRLWDFIEKDPINRFDLRTEIIDELKKRFGLEVTNTQIYHAISGSSVAEADNFPWDLEGGLIEKFLGEKLDKLEGNK